MLFALLEHMELAWFDAKALYFDIWDLTNQPQGLIIYLCSKVVEAIWSFSFLLIFTLIEASDGYLDFSKVTLSAATEL